MANLSRPFILVLIILNFHPSSSRSNVNENSQNGCDASRSMLVMQSQRFSKALLNMVQIKQSIKLNMTGSLVNKANLDRKRLWFLFALLIMHDTELNPGPAPEATDSRSTSLSSRSSNDSDSSAPCGTCDEAVTWDHDGVRCDFCHKWYHTNCQNMSETIYNIIGNKNIVWECLNCGMPNLSSSLFTSAPISLENSFTPLESSRSISNAEHGIRHNRQDGPGSPLATSSPVNPQNHSRPRSGRKPPSRKLLKLLNVNCQSVIPKKGEFQNLIDRTDPDIVVATETWLTDGKHQDGEIGGIGDFSSNYRIFRRDRKDGYGGVFVAVRNSLSSARVEELETNSEIVWVKIKLVGTKTLYISGCYRPRENDEEGHQQLKESLDRVKYNKNSHIWIAGDLNYPGIDWEGKCLTSDCRSPTLHQELLDCLDDHGLTQMVSENTRDDSILDLFITNNHTLINEVKVTPGISDHHAVLVEGDLTPITNKQEKRKIPLFKKADWKGLKEHVRKHVPDRSASPNKIWQDFKTMLESGINKYIPHRYAKTKDSLPWLNNKTKRLMKKRDQAYVQMKKEGSDKTKKEFKRLKKLVQKQVRLAYWDYIKEVVSAESDDNQGNKRLWTYMKHAKQDSSGIAPLTGKDGKKVDDPKGKAEILNEQFSSVFSKLTPLSLAQASAQALRSSFPPSLIPDSENQSYHSPHSNMPDFDISEAGVAKLLKNLKPHKAAGPDAIRPLVLKELHLEISPVLAFIFQKSKETGEVPDEWRQANVVPIYKKGSRSQAANYRPVSLTCICCKVMEHIMSSHIMTHLEVGNILCDRQHGFRSKRSCESQLMELVEDLHRSLNSSHQTDIVVMDFSKAFDKVCHTRLLHKLQWYGIRGQTLGWIKSFLSNRTQRVVVEGVSSRENPVTSGVPQGSVLGPILFLIYINDLPECVTSEVRLFADDTILYREIRNPQDAQALQEDLNQLVKWEQDWLMEFHPGKCQVIRVTRSRSPMTNNYYLHNHQLEVVESTKYLGITISHDLKWNTHINNTTNKAGKVLNMLKRNLKISNPTVKTQAYNSLVRPIAEYAAVVWDPYTKANINKVEMVQRRAARWTLNRYHNTSSVTDMLDHLAWPMLQTRRAEARLCLMYKMVHNLVATNVRLYATPVLRPTRHTHPLGFVRIPSTTETYRMAYFPRSVAEWNKLPANVVVLPTLEAFKDQLVGMRRCPALPAYYCLPSVYM